MDAVYSQKTYKMPQRMMNDLQQKTEAITTVAATGSAWVAWLADLNQVLITLSTVVAIAVGVWTLYEKYRIAKRRDNATSENPGKKDKV